MEQGLGARGCIPGRTHGGRWINLRAKWGRLSHVYTIRVCLQCRGHQEARDYADVILNIRRGGQGERHTHILHPPSPF